MSPVEYFSFKKRGSVQIVMGLSNLQKIFFARLFIWKMQSFEHFILAANAVMAIITSYLVDDVTSASGCIYLGSLLLYCWRNKGKSNITSGLSNTISDNERHESSGSVSVSPIIIHIDEFGHLLRDLYCYLIHHLVIVADISLKFWLFPSLVYIISFRDGVELELSSLFLCYVSLSNQYWFLQYCVKCSFFTKKE